MITACLEAPHHFRDSPQESGGTGTDPSPRLFIQNHVREEQGYPSPEMG